MITCLNNTQIALISYSLPHEQKHELINNFIVINIENPQDLQLKLLSGYKVAEFIESQGRVY